MEKMQSFRKTEAWAATGLYLLLMFSSLYPALITDFHTGDVSWKYESQHIPYNYFLNALMPKLVYATLWYVTFVLVNNWIVPRFLEKQRFWTGIPLLVLVVTFYMLLAMVAYSYQLGYMLGRMQLERFHIYCFGRALMMVFISGVIYAFYYGAKYLYFRHLHAWFQEQGIWKKLTLEMILGLFLWVVWLTTLAQDDRPAAFFVVFWTGVCYLAVYAVIYYFIFPPFHRGQVKKLALARNLLVTAMFSLGVLGLILMSNVRTSLGSTFFVATLGEIFLLFPLAFFLSRARMKQRNEVLTLEKALGRSSANLDFLRSQINPHFLFNALNTLYGTALQENAPRTSEGVQRLGDMMRFMLHENHQEFIELTKEVGYLQNYIALQSLRTQASPDIKIEVNIRENDCDHLIAPMLLIPFVENAFKHGISLRSRSWIVISLSCTERYLYFDAYNSVHTKHENDPEKASLGIGLENVRKRLALIYPGRHELSIRETGTEFFVHLTIDMQP
ncbi:sensor histidine kinase [Chitinophaga lutea]